MTLFERLRPAVALAVWLFAVVVAGCGTIKASHQVVVSHQTLAIVKARPEFAGVECAEGARLAVVGAEVASGALLLSVNCVEF